MRLPNWETSLDNQLQRSDAFAYGAFDCCLFACDAIRAMAGIDPAADFRDKYSTRSEAMRLVKALYGKASVSVVADGVTSKLGMTPCVPLQARRGDVVLIKRPKDYSLGIVDLTGEQIAVATKQGIERIPLEQACKAWHV